MDSLAGQCLSTFTLRCVEFPHAMLEKADSFLNHQCCRPELGAGTGWALSTMSAAEGQDEPGAPMCTL